MSRAENFATYSRGITYKLSHLVRGISPASLMTNNEHRLIGSGPEPDARPYVLRGEYWEQYESTGQVPGNVPDAVMRGNMTPRQTERERRKFQRRYHGFTDVSGILGFFPEGQEIANEFVKRANLTLGMESAIDDWGLVLGFPPVDKKTGEVNEFSTVVGIRYIGEQKKRQGTFFACSDVDSERLTLQLIYSNYYPAIEDSLADPENEYSRRRAAEGREQLAALPSVAAARYRGHYI